MSQIAHLLLRAPRCYTHCSSTSRGRYFLSPTSLHGNFYTSATIVVVPLATHARTIDQSNTQSVGSLCLLRIYLPCTSSRTTSLAAGLFFSLLFSRRLTRGNNATRNAGSTVDVLRSMLGQLSTLVALLSFSYDIQGQSTLPYLLLRSTWIDCEPSTWHHLSTRMRT